MSGADNIGYSKGWGCLTTLCILALLIWFGYEWLDSVGWISHREETLITVNADWLVGESKECWSITPNSRSAPLLNREIGYAMYAVNCGDGPQHSIKVNFYGSEIQGANLLIKWRCEREQPSFLNDDTFTCRETGIELAPTSNP